MTRAGRARDRVSPLLILLTALATSLRGAETQSLLDVHSPDLSVGESLGGPLFTFVQRSGGRCDMPIGRLRIQDRPTASDVIGVRR